MSTALIQQPDLESNLLSAPAAIVISDQTEYEVICAEIRELATVRKQWVDYWSEPKQKAHDAHKSICSKEKAGLDKIDAARAARDRGVVAYQQEQERLRLAEQKRLEDEQRAREEEERIAAAVQAEESGSWPEEVDAILEQPAVPVPVVAPPRVQPVSGISTRQTWKASVVSMRKLIEHIAKHPELDNLLMPNTTAINAMARAQQARLNLPGVQTVPESTVAARAR